VSDYRNFVREHLGPLSLPAERELEIIAELAEHIEDGNEAGLLLRRRGPLDILNWKRLNREIRRAEEDPMNDRTRRLWLPGLVTLAFSALLLMVMVRFGLQPLFWWIDPRMPVVFYVPWLVALPVPGAVGAYWSKRVGGDRRLRFVAGVFPAAAMLGTFLVTFPLAFVIDWHVPALLKLSGLAIYTFAWVVIPGAALLLGVLPFLGNPADRPA